MTPREYIAELQVQKPPRTLTESDLPATVRELLKTGGLDPKHALRNDQDFAQYLFSLLGAKLPSFVHELFNSGFIAVGELGDPIPNAYTKSLGDAGFAILVNSGLADFVYRVARVMSTRFVPTGEQSGPSPESFNETARVVAEIFWWYQETEQAFGPSTYGVTPDQLSIANRLALNAEQFLLAHEIGHIVVTMAGQEAEALFGEWPHELNASHREEFAADRLALRLVMGVSGTETERAWELPLAYAGAEFAFQIYRCLEDLGVDLAGTHPLAGKRLAALRQSATTSCATVADWERLSSLAQGLDAMFQEILRVITSPQEHESFRHTAAGIVAKLHGLLSRCSGGLVPDYMTFYSEASDILAVGYSHVVLGEIAELVADLVRSLAERAEQERDRTAVIKHWQKVKLLFGLTHNLNEPARSVFAKAFNGLGAL